VIIDISAMMPFYPDATKDKGRLVFPVELEELHALALCGVDLASRLAFGDGSGGQPSKFWWFV
jgi:hypothetical protein